MFPKEETRKSDSLDGCGNRRDGTIPRTREKVTFFSTSCGILLIRIPVRLILVIKNCHSEDHIFPKGCSQQERPCVKA
jgi:hypothetical protein